MPKKKKVPPPALTPEDRRAEAVTVAWMLAALFAFLAEVVGLLARIVMSALPERDELSPWLALPILATSIAWVAGIVALLLTPLVYRFRKTPPPELITLFVVLVGLAPPVILLLQWLRG